MRELSQNVMGWNRCDDFGCGWIADVVLDWAVPMMNVRRWWLVVFVLTGCLSGFASAQEEVQEEEVDLYELASDAADEEVKEADEVLAEDERVHGKQWLTRDRLEMIVGGWAVLQLVIAVLVIRDLRKRGRGWLAVTGWLLSIAVAGFLAGLVYWLCRKLGRKNE